MNQTLHEQHMARDIERRDFLKGVTVAGIAGLAGCTGDTGSTPTSTPTSGDGGDGDGGDMEETEDSGGSMSRDSPVRVGILMPETGDLASVGVPIRDGALLPAVQLEGETDFTIETQVADTQTDPQAGISAAQNLVNSGFPAVTGPASSGVNLQVTRQVFIPNQIVGCSPSSTSPNVTTLEDNDFIFRTPPSDALQGRVIAQVGADQLDASSAATMFVNNDYGQALSDSFASAFGGDVANAVSFEKEQPSYTSRLETALQSDPDMLVVIGYPASGIQLFRDYYNDFDTGVDIVVTDGLKDPNLPGEVGSDMSNVIGTAPTAAGPGRDFFTSLYEEEYGEEPGVFTSQAYDATAVLILANVAAGANDGAAIRDNMRVVANPEGEQYGPESLADAVAAVAAGEEINYVGASSPVDFDENGDMQAVTYEIFGFTGDGVETQDTIDFGG
jgi:ABC-type branched-subunit amino acid transport system substrate-binding protein